MDRLGVDLLFVHIHLDDLLIASPNMATHLEHLRLVLQEFGLVINLSKCLWAETA